MNREKPAPESDEEAWAALGIDHLPQSVRESIETVRWAMKGVTPADFAQANSYLAQHSGQFLGGHRLPRIHEEPPPRPEAERETFGRE